MYTIEIIRRYFDHLIENNKEEKDFIENFYKICRDRINDNHDNINTQNNINYIIDESPYGSIRVILESINSNNYYITPESFMRKDKIKKYLSKNNKKS